MPIVRRRVTISASPVAPGRPAEILVREAGAGPAVVLLHGGWGYEAYPWDLDALARRHRVLAPDRAGYGGSGRLPAGLPRGFHRAMAEETLLVLDALGVERAALWGHSDGAIVAAWIAFLAPARVRALVLEALHYVTAKVSSVDFFRSTVDAPERFGPAIVEALARDHGESWRAVVAANGQAWLSLIAESGPRRPDLFEGRLGEVRAPTLLLHGRHDPRTEPGELEAARRVLPAARLALLDAGHCPHASARAGAEATRVAVEFLEEHAT